MSFFPAWIFGCYLILSWIYFSPNDFISIWPNSKLFDKSPLFRMTRLTPTWALDSFKTILHVNEPHPLSHEKCSLTAFILIGLKIAMQFVKIYLLFIQYSLLRIGFVITFSNFRTISLSHSQLSRNWGSISRVSQFWESYNRCCWEALATYQLNFLVCWEASKTTITGAEK